MYIKASLFPNFDLKFKRSKSKSIKAEYFSLMSRIENLYTGKNNAE